MKTFKSSTGIWVLGLWTCLLEVVEMNFKKVFEKPLTRSSHAEGGLVRYKTFKMFNDSGSDFMTPSDPLLKTRQVAMALGVSVSTIKRWIDSGVLTGTRTVGKHRLIRLSEALRFAREQGLPQAELELLVGMQTTHLDVIDDQVRETLTHLLGRGKGREARTLIHSVFASGLGAVALADQLIRPVMERIGRCWMVGAMDVYQEHQATHLVASAVLELIDRVSREQGEPFPLALGAVSEGDCYVLPGLLGELVLREIGWDVRNLSVNLPLQSLANAVLEYQPRLVFLSVSHLADEKRFIREYQSFYETAVARGVAVIVGGRALRPELRAELVFASAGERMAHLSEFARWLHPTADGARTQNGSAHL